jgi:hypothetical protein
MLPLTIIILTIVLMCWNCPLLLAAADTDELEGI